jgi:hypothetical protein
MAKTKRASVQEAAQQAVAGDPIDPSYLDAVPVDAMSTRYAEVFHYFADHGPPFIRASNYVGVCSVCGGRVVKLVAKVPGAVRFDTVCSVCGEDEFHTAGWTNDDEGNAARASVRGGVK